LVDTLRKIGERHGKAPGEVALAWTLANPAVTAAIVGLRRPDQVNGTLGALDFRLLPDELAEIESFFEQHKEAVSV
jgi:aryl-alcohol dehydrogenase-like predicted oxidoreductase